ncbi:MAG: deoxynucleoside kinase [Bacteroidia bacterium]|nr:deoxynucleoside kinase [Bacteroidia bacterium]MCX7764946.1 deoxynucleoside kinase [Bacteroidia bacterium]MDW8057741.1 deoxynucleoside kinase [Bacteroidia bacterium]
MHIALAGNIGAGKTYATYILSQALRYEAVYENDQDNPFLLDFYQDMVRWAFPMQIYLLNKRLETTLHIQRSGKDYVQDRTMYEDAEVFAPVLRDMDILPAREYEVYRALFEKIASLVRPPDLLVYLKASVPVLVEQILARGRPYEENISLEYLRKLNQAYNAWYESYDRGPKLMILMDELHGREDGPALLVDQVVRRVVSLF